MDMINMIIPINMDNFPINIDKYGPFDHDILGLPALWALHHARVWPSPPAGRAPRISWSCAGGAPGTEEAQRDGEDRWWMEIYWEIDVMEI